METISSKFQYIWYGTCQESSCSDLLFTDIDQSIFSQIESISTLTDTGFQKFVQNGIAQIDRFKCGKMYLVKLKDSALETGIVIPNSLSSSSQSIGKYGISVDCSEISASPTPSPVTTPTPVPTPTPITTPTPSPITTPSPAVTPSPVATPSPVSSTCSPTSFKSLEGAVGDKVKLDGVGSVTFRDDGIFSVNTADFTQPTVPVSLFVRDNGFAVISIALDHLPAEGITSSVFFDCKSVACEGKCFTGVIEKVGEDYEVNLTEV